MRHSKPQTEGRPKRWLLGQLQERALLVQGSLQERALLAQAALQGRALPAQGSLRQMRELAQARLVPVPPEQAQAPLPEQALRL